jgi:hypothetical protein
MLIRYLRSLDNFIVRRKQEIIKFNFKMNREERAKEDKALLNLMLENPDKFQPADYTYRLWTYGEWPTRYSALRLGRIIYEANATEEINKKSRSGITALISEGGHNFEQENIFDYNESKYTAELKDLNQNLFIYTRTKK